MSRDIATDLVEALKLLKEIKEAIELDARWRKFEYTYTTDLLPKINAVLAKYPNLK